MAYLRRVISMMEDLEGWSHHYGVIANTTDSPTIELKADERRIAVDELWHRLEKVEAFLAYMS